MLKYSSLILVVVASTFWSQADAKPATTILKRSAGAPSLKFNKRQIDDVTKAELKENLVKQLVADMLMLTIRSKSEQRALSAKYIEALEKKWDSLDDYYDHVLKVYEEVTGRKPGEGDQSDQSDQSV